MIESKLPNIGTSIFTIMSQLANEHNAINLGQGFPDFNPDKQLIDLVYSAMQNGHNQYPAMAGIEPLREVISNKIKTLYNKTYKPETEITITSGATEALMVAIQTVVKPGDEVIVIEPCYDLYVPAIKLAGGIPVFVKLDTPTINKNKFSLDWNKLKSAITDKTSLIILNFPHNPTGITLSQEDLNSLNDIIKQKNIYLIADEVYEHIVFNYDKKFNSIASHSNLADRCFIISSFGKTYHTTGWKIGYCAAPEFLMKEFRKIHQFTVFTVSSPMQYALAKFSSDPSTYNQLSSFYEKKRDLLYDGLKQTRFKPIKSEGTFFLLAQYENISSQDEFEFTKQLTIEHGITTIPISAFYANPDLKSSNNHLIRFCFAKKDETLIESIEKLKKL